MQIEFLGHAGLIVASGRVSVACDPWISPQGAFDASWFQLPCNHHLWERDYGGLAAVVLSHEHQDHLDAGFLAQKISPEIPLIVPAYPSGNLRRKIRRACSNPVVEVGAGEEHLLGGELRVLFTPEESPANQDSVVTFIDGESKVIDMNDARLTLEQAEALRDRSPQGVDVVLLQCAGASWYPICYDYSRERMAELCAEKRQVKLEYAYQVLERLRPGVAIPFAGPPAFLDGALFRHNDDMGGRSIFPDQRECLRWLAKRGYGGRQELLMPGDRLDSSSGELSAAGDSPRESWLGDKEAYLRGYADRMRPAIAEYLSSLEAPTGDLFERFREHFMRLGGLSDYFRKRIDMDIRFRVEGEFGGDFLVRCRPQGCEVLRSRGEKANYTIQLDQLWMHRILAGELPWEDFFLSCRFSASRAPDVYNDHLLSWLKWADTDALAAIEAFETRPAEEETIVVRSPAGRFRVAKYCPHAGAPMEDALVEGRTITCLNHHYRFDLLTGECQTGNCRLWTERLPD